MLATGVVFLSPVSPLILVCVPLAVMLLAYEMRNPYGFALAIVFLALAFRGGSDASTPLWFAGRAWGRRKLAPKISPNKSVEGALGGVIFGVSCAMATKLVFDSVWPDLSRALPGSTALFFALVLCGVGIIGDLVESLLKRDAEVKDTGALLPGMGGVLDRLDAPLLGLPTMYYLMLAYIWLQGG